MIWIFMKMHDPSLCDTPDELHFYKSSGQKESLFPLCKCPCIFENGTSHILWFRMLNKRKQEH